jgi:hypothetical protein
MGKKRSTEAAGEGGGRARLDLRADPAWLVRVERQAARRGISVTAYIKQAVSLALEADEQTDPLRRAEDPPAAEVPETEPGRGKGKRKGG